jgi:pimeloyl-ACP methyl ester carboxylesterase
MPLAELIAPDEALLTGAIERPHPDIELGVARGPLSYIGCAPTAGITADTGLVLYLGGYGMNPRDGYTASLLSYLANAHNCVAATVDYFGARMIQPTPGRIAPHPEFFAKLAQHYGVAITAPKGIAMEEILAGVTGLLARNGITHLHEECTLLNNAAEYNSMGFLPALDGLKAVHQLTTRLALNKRRLFLLGTSYGGYIACLMAKLAPQTFRMVVDNSGFSSAEDDLPALLGWHKIFLNGVSILCQNVRNWSFDRRQPNFFSEARKAIRDLRLREHVYVNTARIYAYHAATDTVAPTARKIGLRDAFHGRAEYDLAIIDEAQIDGRVFKNLTHGMNASLRGVFDLSYRKFQRHGGALLDTTDFDLGSEYVFACGSEDYVVRFSSADGVRAVLYTA